LLQQLERATNPAYRNVLLNGLKAVEKEIEEVSLKVSP
jgi:TATA-binding protein-associated factor Taf7